MPRPHGSIPEIPVAASPFAPPPLRAYCRSFRSTAAQNMACRDCRATQLGSVAMSGLGEEAAREARGERVQDFFVEGGGEDCAGSDNMG